MDKQELLEKFESFQDDKYSLIISSVDEECRPLTSYSPFVVLDGNYYICVSSMLPHYKNMMTTKRVHVMIMEDESRAENIYARKRLYFSADCELEEDAEKIFKLFDKRYKDQLSFFRNMKDFKVIKLTAGDKSLVLGFGAAYKLDKNHKLSSKNISHQS